MEQKPCTAYSSSLLPREDNPEFNLRDWDSKASRISRQTTNSRRFSASNITGLREDPCRSFRSNITISSTASSPGYPFKALQAKSAYNNLDCLSPEGFALNSKWNDAEKYICNPLSGQVPMECLSARSFRNSRNRITMSAPLIYFAKTRTAQPKPSLTARKSLFQIPIEEKEVVGMTRDVGIQSTEADIKGSSSSSSSSSSPSPTSTPSIGERMYKRFATESGELSNSTSKPKSEEEVGAEKGGGGEEEGKVESSKGDLITGESHQKGSYDDDRHHDREADQEDDQEEEEKIHSHSHRRRWQPSGCLSWMRSRRLQWHKVRPQRTNKKPLFVSCSSARRC
ncbi:uncharacterized protein LOC116209381 isoform X2 [Punica granatum]|uniref:Uncharacterized protein LOC116209381 isoform X2 n=1 Tax=Punica granatum TaxID=22663 RepID=A0A6P8DWX8_PUNGR|nr:uncharacterized protein LOC116209381 isoform X2 [Punica granatum]